MIFEPIDMIIQNLFEYRLVLIISFTMWFLVVTWHIMYWNWVEMGFSAPTKEERAWFRGEDEQN